MFARNTFWFRRYQIHRSRSTISKPTGKASLDEKRYVPLSRVQSLYDCRAEVIIPHAPGTSDACETHARLVEEFIASLALRLC